MRDIRRELRDLREGQDGGELDVETMKTFEKRSFFLYFKMLEYVG